MIALKVNGEFLDLSDNFSLRFEVFGVVGHTNEQVQGDYSFPVSLPATPKNRRILGWMDYITNTEKPQRLPVEVYVKNIVHKTGTLLVSAATRTEYTASIIGGVGKLNNGTDPKLRDMDMGEWGIDVGDNIASAAAAAALMATTISMAPADTPVVFFPIQNGVHFDSSGFVLGYGIVLNHYSGGFDGDIDGMAYGNAVWWPACAPAIYASHIIRSIFAYYGLTVINDMEQDDELKLLTYFPNASLLYFADAELPKEYKYNLPFNIASTMPQEMTAWKTLQDMMGMFNMAIYWDEGAQAMRLIFLRDVVTSDVQADWTPYASSWHEVQTDYIPPVLSFKFNREALDSYEAMIRSVDGLNYLGYVADETMLPGSPAVGDTYLVLNDMFYATFKSTGWIIWGIELNNRSVLNSTREVESDTTPTEMNLSQADIRVPGRTWKLPDCPVPGKFSHLAGNFDVERKNRMILYRGMQLDSASNTYPMGSTSTHDLVGNQIGNYALQWNGPYGLYETWYKDWQDFMLTTRMVKRRLMLPIEELQNWDPRKKVRIAEVNYLVQQISYTVSTRGIAQAELTLLTA